MGGLGSPCRSRVSVKERRKRARGTLVFSGGGRGWDGHEPALRKKAERGRRTVAGERVEGRGWRTALSSGEAAGAAAPKGSLQSGTAAWGQRGLRPRLPACPTAPHPVGLPGVRRVSME